jgi:hypothetical protein
VASHSLLLFSKRTVSTRSCHVSLELCTYGHLLFIIAIYLGGVSFEVFAAVTMKNAVFWDVTPCGSNKEGVSEEHRFLQEPNIPEHGILLLRWGV